MSVHGDPLEAVPLGTTVLIFRSKLEQLDERVRLIPLVSERNPKQLATLTD